MGIVCLIQLVFAIGYAVYLIARELQGKAPPPDRRDPAARAWDMGLYDLADELERRDLSPTQRREMNEELDRVGDMLAVGLSDEDF